MTKIGNNLSKLFVPVQMFSYFLRLIKLLKNLDKGIFLSHSSVIAVRLIPVKGVSIMMPLPKFSGCE